MVVSVMVASVTVASVVRLGLVEILAEMLAASVAMILEVSALTATTRLHRGKCSRSGAGFDSGHILRHSSPHRKSAFIAALPG
jgi:hypothetical protein